MLGNTAIVGKDKVEEQLGGLWDGCGSKLGQDLARDTGMHYEEEEPVANEYRDLGWNLERCRIEDCQQS